jgi:hypothetical protein
MITGNQFCDWDCQSDLTAIIMMFLFVSVSCVTVYCFIIYRKINQSDIVEKELLYKFKAMIAWGIGIVLCYAVFMCNITFSILIYFISFRDHIDNQINLPITWYSSVYAFL